MAGGCGSCGKKSSVKYLVNFNNGSASQKYDTIEEAQKALTAAGRPAGASFKAVAG